MCRVSFFQLRLKVKLESLQHFQIWLEKFVPTTNQCSLVWRNREINSWCVVQMKRNTWLPLSIKLPLPRYPFETRILFSFSEVLFFRRLSIWMGKEDISSHCLLYQTLFSVFFLDQKIRKNNWTWGNTRATVKNPWHALLYHLNWVILSLSA